MTVDISIYPLVYGIHYTLHCISDNKCPYFHYVCLDQGSRFSRRVPSV